MQRVVATLSCPSALPFLDVDAAETHAYLSEVMASELTTLGHRDRNLDISDVRGPDRRLSRAISRWAYTAARDDGDWRYFGIRYMSRIKPEWECWAIFDGTPVELIDSRGITRDDPDLRFVADLWQLNPF